MSNGNVNNDCQYIKKIDWNIHSQLQLESNSWNSRNRCGKVCLSQSTSESEQFKWENIRTDFQKTVFDHFCIWGPRQIFKISHYYPEKWWLNQFRQSIQLPFEFYCAEFAFEWRCYQTDYYECATPFSERFLSSKLQFEYKTSNEKVYAELNV